METTLTIIQTLGFPICTALGMGYYIYKMQTEERAENKAREERLYSMLEKFGDSIDNLTNTLQGVDKRLSILEKYYESEE